MEIRQIRWMRASGWSDATGMAEAALVLVFGGSAVLDAARIEELRQFYPDAILAGCSTSGQGLDGTADLALLVSCVGRRLVLGQRVEDEIEGVRRTLGPGPALAGFYSYGELTPYAPTGRCELHNQTMTVTTLAEN